MPGSRMCQHAAGRHPGIPSRRIYHRAGAWVAALSLLLVAMPAAHGWPQSDGDAAERMAATGNHAATSARQTDETTAYGGKAQSGGDMATVSVIGVLGRLALIAVLAYAVVWGLRQWRDRGVALPHSGRGGLIRVRESVSLGGAGRLYVVQFGARSLLISAVGDKVTLLTGNSASEVASLDTCSIPPQSARETAGVERDTASQADSQMGGHEANGARLRAEHRRRTSDWESRRDALVRALQSSVES